MTEEINFNCPENPEHSQVNNFFAGEYHVVHCIECRKIYSEQNYQPQ